MEGAPLKAQPMPAPSAELFEVDEQGFSQERAGEVVPAGLEEPPDTL